MRQKFIESLDKFLTEKTVFKSDAAFCNAVGYDRAGLSRFKRSMELLKKGEQKSELLKFNFTLDTISKMVDVMGGELLFPWDKDADASHMEIIKLKKELEQSREKIILLEKELYACEQTRERYENIIRDKIPSANDVPAEIRQEKSSA